MASRDREPSASVVEDLEATRREMRRYRRSLGRVRLALAALGMAALVAWADWMWVMPAPARLAALGLLAAVAVLIAAREIVAPSRRYGREEAAAEVEAGFPDLGQRVRTTLEYVDPTPATAPASPALVGALVADTDRRTRSLDFRALVPWRTFEKAAVGLVVAGVASLVTLFVSPGLRTATGRLLFLPLHYTDLQVKPGSRTIKAGGDFDLTATLAGRPVREARWQYRRAGSSGPWTTASLAPTTAPDARSPTLIGSLRAGLKDCQADFDYRVTAGELESPTYRVTVTHPLKLLKLAATVTPPAYTRRPASVEAQGNFRAIEGSKVRFKITLDRAPGSAALAYTPAGEREARRIPLAVRGRELEGELPPIDKDARYEIIAKADDGQTLDSDPYQIRVQADEKPTVRLVRPVESYAVTPTTEVPVQVEAADDFGVAKVGIRYKVGDGPEESLFLEDLKGQPVDADRLVTLYLEKHEVSYPDAITYYAFAEDGRPGTPRRVTTELRFIDILPYKQEYALSDADGGSPPPESGASTSLEELIARQRVSLNRTFAHQDDRPVDAEVAKRLVKFQAELAKVAEEFVDGLEERVGPIPVLREAVAAMQSAATALESPDLKAARTQEELAVAALIRARQNLRTVLSSKGGKGKAGRKYDREQAQKIRRPPADKDAEERAQVEEDLEELAKQERKFAEEIAAKGGGGAEFDKPDDAQTKAQPPSEPQESEQQSMAERMEAAAREAQRLKELARKDDSLSELARERMAAAAKAVQEANEAMKQGQPEEAARRAREAAEALERLARQVGGLKATELAAKLARARDLAQGLAKQEKALGEGVRADLKDGAPSGPDQPRAEAQAGLAEEAKTLADLIKRLRTDAADESRDLSQAVARAEQANPPAAIEDAMRQVASALAAGRREPAAEGAGESARKLDDLARDLEAARRAYVQPQLDRLLAAEKQAAAAQQAMGSVKSEAQQQAAAKALAELARTLQQSSPGEGPVRDAADALSQALASGGGWTQPRDHENTRKGLFTPTGHAGAVGRVITALQAQIQELILNDALVDRDGAVPPQYKALVEDYYRILSQDLR